MVFIIYYTQTFNYKKTNAFSIDIYAYMYSLIEHHNFILKDSSGYILRYNNETIWTSTDSIYLELRANLQEIEVLEYRAEVENFLTNNGCNPRDVSIINEFPEFYNLINYWHSFNPILLYEQWPS